MNQDDEIIASEGYSRNQLKNAFEKVENKSNWKMPTNWIVVSTKDEAILIQRAVIFFTGGCPKISERFTGDGFKYLVSETRGYYYYIGA